MTSSIMPPLVPPKPSPGRLDVPVRGRRALPLPELPTGGAGSLICGMAAVDRDGRVSDTAVIGVMGWQPGTRLDIRVSGGLVLVTADERAVFRVTRPGQVRLPAQVRHRCGLIGGSRILLVAYPDAGLLVVQPPASWEAMVTHFYAAALGGDVG
jgi:hypothetical protein